MKTILCVFGTRPEAIKMAPVVNELKKSTFFSVKICVTAQHREMLDQVLSIFSITPDYDLDIMKKGQDLYDITTRIMTGIKQVINDCKPDCLLVHGDTTTSFSAALAAYYSGVKIGHVEAGLRTYNLDAPWPEEANRQLTGRLANFNFAPTQKAADNLSTERVSGKTVITGNTVIDALFWVVNRMDSDKEDETIALEIGKKGYLFSNRKVILVTGHRRENFGQGFLEICEGLKTIAVDNPDIDIVYPVHLNPNVQKPVNEILNSISNIYLIPPLEYKQFVFLMKSAYIILTDSGGIQEEAPSLGIPVLVMRDTTERPEAVEAGTVKLVGANSKKICVNVELLLNDKQLYEKMSKANNPYGDGRAAVKIVKGLEAFLL